jgi:hypothetical protein
MPGKIHKYILFGEDLVRHRRFATTTTLRSSVGNEVQLVHTTRRYFPGTGIDLSSAENKGRLKTTQRAAKCRTLLLYSMWMLSRNGGTATAEWMQCWRLMETDKNPPHRNRIPSE